MHAREAAAFAGDPALVLVSPLASGADQLAAIHAAAHGFALHAVLPFARDVYRADFSAGAAASFDTLLAGAARALELPGRRDTAKRAYALAGRATIAHADLLIAVWDGLPARGTGGTAEVVEYALRRGVPVIHVPSQADRPARLIWSAHDPHMAHSHADEISAHALDRARLDGLLATLLAPPADEGERALAAEYAAEAERRWRLRTEYSLLLALAGIRRPGRLRTAAYEASGDAPGEAAYVWADRLAAHFAQTYRSGHVFNFAFGALAVCSGCAGSSSRSPSSTSPSPSSAPSCCSSSIPVSASHATGTGDCSTTARHKVVVETTLPIEDLTELKEWIGLLQPVVGAAL